MHHIIQTGYMRYIIIMLPIAYYMLPLHQVHRIACLYTYVVVDDGEDKAG